MAILSPYRWRRWPFPGALSPLCESALSIQDKAHVHGDESLQLPLPQGFNLVNRRASSSHTCRNARGRPSKRKSGCNDAENKEKKEGSLSRDQGPSLPRLREPQNWGSPRPVAETVWVKTCTVCASHTTGSEPVPAAVQPQASQAHQGLHQTEWESRQSQCWG